MSWKDHLTGPELELLACFENMISESTAGINRVRLDINTLRKRAGKRMERAKTKERDNDHP